MKAVIFLKHYYPDNMEAPAMILLWKWKDFWICLFGAAISVIIAGAAVSLIPVVPIALYAVMTITFYNELTIKSYLGLFFRYFFQQQIFLWRD